MSLSEKYKTALVTGGAGFVGSHLVKRLLKEGLKVVSVDDYSSGKKYNLSDIRDNNFFEEECDITDKAKMRSIFSSCNFDIVFHNAASKKNICLKDPGRDLEVNGFGAFNLLKLSKEFNVKKFVHASTGSVYGEARYFPQDEEHPLVPLSYYGVSKLAGEKYCKLFSETKDLNTTVLRYFHVFGPNQECDPDLGGVVAIFLDRAKKGLPLVVHGDGMQQRSFTHVDDIVNINLFVAQSEETRGEAYNCASGVNVTILELAKAVQGEYGEGITIQYAPPLDGDIKIFDVSNNKLKNLGFKFSTNFRDGLKELFQK